MRKGFYIVPVLLIMMSWACGNRYHSKPLMESNHFYSEKWDYFLKVDTLATRSNDQYCFQIRHEDAFDLDSFKVAIEIDGKVVYSDIYKDVIVFNFDKKTNLNTLVIYFYSPDKHSYWQNKDVYDFEHYPKKCYTIFLLDRKSMDNSNGIQMRLY